MIRRLALAALAALALFPAAASAQVITSTPPSCAKAGANTVTASAPVLDCTQTWNNAGITFYGFRLNVTDTASASGSLLMDLQVAGSSKFSVDKAGLLTTSNGFSTQGNISIAAAAGYFINNDVRLVRDAANTLALRNGASAQRYNVYGTYTDASNFERLSLIGSGTAFSIGTDSLGTGAARPLQFYVSGTNIFKIETTGHLLWNADNTYDIGASGATRPRDLFNARDHILGRHLSSSGAAPAVTSCGTSPAIAGSDLAGEVTTGTATPTACTITFNVAYAAQPYCVVEDRSALANLTSYTVSTSAIVLTTAAASSQKVVYHCIGA